MGTPTKKQSAKKSAKKTKKSGFAGPKKPPMRKSKTAPKKPLKKSSKSKPNSKKSTIDKKAGSPAPTSNAPRFMQPLKKDKGGKGKFRKAHTVCFSEQKKPKKKRRSLQDTIQ